MQDHLRFIREVSYLLPITYLKEIQFGHKKKFNVCFVVFYYFWRYIFEFEFEKKGILY